jgi:hypothetical protein
LPSDGSGEHTHRIANDFCSDGPDGLIGSDDRGQMGDWPPARSRRAKRADLLRGGVLQWR